MALKWFLLVSVLTFSFLNVLHAFDCPAVDDPRNVTLVVFNRVPKCGSTTMIRVMQHLGRDSGIFEASNQPADSYYMMQPFESNTTWSEKWEELKRYAEDIDQRRVFINHMFWPDLASRLPTSPSPHYIQVLREPISREISTYYYKMMGPRKEESMSKARKTNMKYVGVRHMPTINEFITVSVRKHGKKCCSYVKGIQGLKCNTMTRFFCGFHPVCEDICSEVALSRAKTILLQKYKWVGILEHLRASLQLLRHELPSWFGNIVQTYSELTANFPHGERVTNGVNEAPTNETLEILRIYHKQDIALYAFALEVLKKKVHACLTNSIT